MYENVPGAIEALRTGDSDQIKELANTLRSDQNLRQEFAQSDQLWIAVVDSLKSYDSTLRLRVLQFAANLSATHGIAPASENVVTWYARSKISQQEDQVMWSVIANLAQNKLSPLSLLQNELKSAILRAAQLPKTNALAFALFCECQTAANFALMVPAFEVIFLHYERWFESQDSAQQGACDLILRTIANACKCDPSEMSEFWNLFDTSASVQALQVLDAAVSLGSVPPIDLLLKNLVEFASRAMPLFGDSEGRNSDLALKHYFQLNTTLRTLVTVSTELPKAGEYRKSLKAGGALEVICRILAEAQKLPVKSKLGLPDSDNSILDLHDFPFVKVNAIPLFTALLASDEEPEQMSKDRDFCRESGALAAVISCCTIDDNNPHQRERAIVAIRCALAGSRTNQEFVENLEVKGVANTADLQAAGLEIELDSQGKPQVKSSPNAR